MRHVHFIFAINRAFIQSETYNLLLASYDTRDASSLRNSPNLPAVILGYEAAFSV